MFCTKCGHELSSNGTCPNCGYTDKAYANTAPEQQKKEKKSVFLKKPTSGSKSYAAIFSALMFFPAMLCTVINVVFTPNSTWAGYVIGALIVLWTFIVLPVLRILPSPVTVLICFISLSLYLLYVARMVGLIGWYATYAVPICFIICALFAITCVMISTGVAKGLHIVSLLTGETAVFLMAIEAIFDFNRAGSVHLTWSLIFMSILVSVAVLCEAVSYASNTKK